MVVMSVRPGVGVPAAYRVPDPPLGDDVLDARVRPVRGGACVGVRIEPVGGVVGEVEGVDVPSVGVVVGGPGRVFGVTDRPVRLTRPARSKAVSFVFKSDETWGERPSTARVRHHATALTPRT